MFNHFSDELVWSMLLVLVLFFGSSVASYLQSSIPITIIRKFFHILLQVPLNSDDDVSDTETPSDVQRGLENVVVCKYHKVRE